MTVVWEIVGGRRSLQLLSFCMPTEKDCFRPLEECQKHWNYWEVNAKVAQKPTLWCGIYSRPTTKTVPVPSVVLINKTAHVKSNTSSVLSVSLRSECRRQERRTFFFHCENPPTDFLQLPPLSVIFVLALTPQCDILAHTVHRVLYSVRVKELIKQQCHHL